MSYLRRLALPVGVLLFVACTSSDRFHPTNGGNQDMAMAPAGDMAQPPPPDMAKPPYPAGPYGNMMGNTLADIALEGYRLTPTMQDSSQLTYDNTIRLSEFHNNPSCKCLFITIGAGWCGPCQEEQSGLIADVMNDSSFCVLNVLLEGQSQTALATQQDVYTWTQQFMQDFYVVRGTQSVANQFENGYGNSIGLPFNFVVDPKTMSILWQFSGYDPMGYQDAMSYCSSN